MKVLIWVLTIIIGTTLNTLIDYAIGIKAGSILLYLVEFYIAKKLCEKWDQRKKEKQDADSASVNDADTATPINTAEANSIPNMTEHLTQYCSHCGSKLFADSEFCSNCGNKIEK